MTIEFYNLSTAKVYNGKIDFLRYEVGILSLKAALSTRAKNWPVYSFSCKETQRKNVRSGFRELLDATFIKYSASKISESEHVEYIVKITNYFSVKYAKWLYDGRLRFGVAQKLINVYLKYLWAAGLCDEPPHCPVDGIVRDLASLDYDWTSDDSAPEYLKAIDRLKLKALPRSLSVWELQEFLRREQSYS